LVEIFNRAVDETAESERLGSRGDEFILPEDHILAGAFLESDEIAGVRIVVDLLILFELSDGKFGNIEFRNAGELIVKEVAELIVDPVTLTAEVGNDEEIFGAGEGDIEDAHDIEGRHTVEGSPEAIEKRMKERLLDARAAIILRACRERRRGTRDL